MHVEDILTLHALLQELDIWAQLVAQKAVWKVEKAVVSRESPATPGTFTFMIGYVILAFPPDHAVLAITVADLTLDPSRAC